MRNDQIKLVRFKVTAILGKYILAVSMSGKRYLILKDKETKSLKVGNDISHHIIAAGNLLFVKTFRFLTKEEELNLYSKNRSKTLKEMGIQLDYTLKESV